MSGAEPQRYPYELLSEWRVQADIAEVYDTLLDEPALPRWWPEAYHAVRVIAEGDEQKRGRIVGIVTRGFLPYDLNWQIEPLAAERPTMIRIKASGELQGVGEWNLRQEGQDVVLTYDWRVRAGKRWMQRVEFLLKPFFVINHRWVMKRGEAGLRRELARRRAEGRGSADVRAEQ